MKLEEKQALTMAEGVKIIQKGGGPLCLFKEAKARESLVSIISTTYGVMGVIKGEALKSFKWNLHTSHLLQI